MAGRFYPKPVMRYIVWGHDQMGRFCRSNLVHPVCRSLPFHWPPKQRPQFLIPSWF